MEITNAMYFIIITALVLTAITRFLSLSNDEMAIFDIITLVCTVVSLVAVLKTGDYHTAMTLASVALFFVTIKDCLS